MVRRAKEKDVPKIGDLLSQVCLVHHRGRPDIFKIGRKYADDELLAMLADDERPILVAVDENDCVLGYCFGIFERHSDHAVLTDVKTLYIDDLCVDEGLRGQHIGSELYRAALSLAKEHGCYNLTLNVWSCNPSAIKFYEAMGLVPQKICMELLLSDNEEAK